MKIKIAPTLDSNNESKIPLIVSFTEQVNKHIKDKFYGQDLEEILISLFLVKIKEGFEHLYKKKKPQYIKHKVIVNKFTGLTIELNKIFMYDVYISSDEYDSLLIATDEEILVFLKKKIIESLEILNDLPKKVFDFDKLQFKADIAMCL